MTSEDFIIREIQSKDNAQVAKIIRSVLIELGVPKVGTAYEDKATDDMFEHFQKETSAYYVLEHKNKIIGGVGIAKLDNFKGNVCELQKMYFAPIARGKGLGSKLITTCLEKAKSLNANSSEAEVFNIMGQLQSLQRIKKSGELENNTEKKEQLTQHGKPKS